jgi:periplasmic protein TonB
MSYLQERSTFRLSFGLTAVVLLHVGLLLALMNGLALRVIKQRPPITDLVPVVTPDEAPPPPPREPVAGENMDRFDVPVPVMPDIPIAWQDDTATPIWQPTLHDDDASYVSAQPRITAPRVDPGHPLTQPEYPPASIRQGEVGTVTLLVYVLPDGRVADAKVSRSSGFARLDAAAVREAKRAWRFLPATADGTPIAEWGTYAVTFRLTN